jgi:hypothetical protein
MAWSIEGRYFENCSCDVLCPCTASLDLGADNDFCYVVLVFHIDSGEIEGTDVSGRTVAVLVDSPKYMHEGNWRVGVLMDDEASDEQAQQLGRWFGGELGGPIEALGPLLGENLGAERVPMEFSSEGGRHRLTMGDAGSVAVEDVVPFGSDSEEPARMTGIRHPVGTELTISKATESDVHAFGIELANVGGAGFSTKFAWSG